MFEEPPRPKFITKKLGNYVYQTKHAPRDKASINVRSKILCLQCQHARDTAEIIGCVSHFRHAVHARVRAVEINVEDYKKMPGMPGRFHLRALLYVSRAVVFSRKAYESISMSVQRNFRVNLIYGPAD